MTTASTWSIARRIAERASADPGRPALTVDGETWSYGELVGAARALGAAWPAAVEGEPAPVTAIMAHRHGSSYVGILAAILRGHTYVPINVEHPPARNLAVLRKSRAARLVIGQGAVEAAAGLLAEGVEAVRCGERKSDHPGASGDAPPAEVPADRRAYILFTSGSTGEPKGVPISHRALTGYLDAASGLMPAGPDDRFSQTFELTFDLSVHDLLLCWTNGAHLIVPTPGELARPADYIRDRQITRWFSVPSLAYQMRLQGDLKPSAFPSIRTSLFCGEALPSVLADEWAAAAPNGSVENWYGPTEATIACARYVLPKPDGKPPVHDLAPIGEAFEGMRLSIHNEDLSPAPDGTPGELFLSGRQLSEGYLDDPERNARTFIRLPGEDVISYRTGDRVVRDPGGPVRFLGRVDNQVKVRGFRIELGEIEAVLRPAAGGVNAIAMSWPPEEPSGRFVVAALETASADADAVIAEAAKSLPDYMVPAHVVCLPAFPKNASGKADRKAVAEQVRGLLAAGAETSVEPDPTPAGRLMQAIRLVSPTLDPQRVRTAPTVMAAGMDSLSFIGLTAEIERLYGRTLGQEEVVELSLLSFDGMLAKLEARRSEGFLDRLLAPFKALFGKKAAGPEGLTHRTNRALQFITRFPQVLADTELPLVICIGSSGTFRGIEPEAFEAEARRLGHNLACLNVGLPAISNTGLARLAGFVREACDQAGVRPATVIYELDPMQVSVLPPSRETPLPESFFTGDLKPFPDGQLKPEFEWSADARGVWIHGRSAATGKRRPNWEKERDSEVARTFAGDVEFVPSELAVWSEAVRTLQPPADRTVVFIHPANAAMMAELPADKRGDRFEKVLAEVGAMEGVELAPPSTFDLEDADFLDINHVNPGQGRPKLSAQLARRLFDRV